MQSLTSTTFDTALTNEKLVLVDFWATWCGPCKAIAPILEELSVSRDDVTITKLDVDENSDVAVRFGVQSIPTLILFQNGAEVGRLNGAHPRGVIEKFLDDAPSRS